MFQDHWQINKVYTPANDDTEDVNNFISEFENTMLEDSDDSSAWLVSSSVLSIINEVFIDDFHALYNIHISNMCTQALFDTGASINAISQKFFQFYTAMIQTITHQQEGSLCGWWQFGTHQWIAHQIQSR